MNMHKALLKGWLWFWCNILFSSIFFFFFFELRVWMSFMILCLYSYDVTAEIKMYSLSFITISGWKKNHRFDSKSFVLRLKEKERKKSHKNKSWTNITRKTKHLNFGASHIQNLCIVLNMHFTTVFMFYFFRNGIKK